MLRLLYILHWKSACAPLGIISSSFFGVGYCVVRLRNNALPGRETMNCLEAGSCIDLVRVNALSACGAFLVRWAYTAV